MSNAKCCGRDGTKRRNDHIDAINMPSRLASAGLGIQVAACIMSLTAFQVKRVIGLLHEADNEHVHPLLSRECIDQPMHSSHHEHPSMLISA